MKTSYAITDQLVRIPRKRFASFFVLFLTLLLFNQLNAQTFYCPERVGGPAQATNNTFQWNGLTASTVTVNNDDRNSSGEPNIQVVDQVGSPTYSGATITNYSFLSGRRWNKNGGYTCPNYPTCPANPTVNNYIGRVILDFSPAVPANEIFVEMFDADRRGVTGTVPDGAITFLGGATPADFEQLTSSSAGSPAVYNADGSITWGISGTATDTSKYVAVIGATTALVARITMFVRN